MIITLNILNWKNFFCLKKAEKDIKMGRALWKSVGNRQITSK